MSFFSELKRRNVVRVGIAYVLIAWVLLQAADFGLDLIDAPNWVIQALFLVAAIGLPAILVFSWIFEITPEGLKLDREVDREASIARGTGRKLDRVIIVVLAVAVAGLVSERFMPNSPAPDTAVPEIEINEQSPSEPVSPGEQEQAGQAPAGLDKSVAVLPFVNMSADADNEFFSDGVSEEILNVLARIPELKVAARTSAFSYKGLNQNIATIARELGVSYVLEGSVRKAGNQVRVTAQLIKADDGFHLWSETYDRELDNIFAIQDDIAGQIAEALKVTFAVNAGPASNLTGTTSLAAYEQYLRGIGLWHERTAESLQQALEAFEAARAADPDFAKAYAGLALTWTVWSGYMLSDSAESANNAREYATTAIELDPSNSEAYAALGNAASRFWEQWDESEAHYRTAIDLNPSYATAYQWYGRLKFIQGDYAEASRLMEKALALDPRARIISTNLAWVWLTDNQYERAREQFNAAVTQHPDFPDAWAGMLTINMLLGDCAGVRQAAGRLTEILQKKEDSSGTYVRLCEAETVQARNAILQEMLSWGPFDFFSPDSKHLGYDIDLWVVATEFEAFDAAADLLAQMTIQWAPGELAWLRNDRRPNAIRFNCSETAQSLYREKNAAPARDAKLCRE
jgi:TolB-like protein/Tfp pilus assembly protein PilF